MAKIEKTTTLANERAAKALNAAVDNVVKTATTVQANLEKVVATALGQLTAEVDQASATLQHLTEAVEDKQVALSNLETEFASKLDEAQYKLRLDVRDNEEAVLRGLLNKNGLAEIKTADLADLTREVEALKRDNSEMITEAVNTAVEQAEAKAAAILSAARAENKVEIAQFAAKAQSDATTIKLLQEQLAQARDDLAAERKARVDVEQYRSQASGVTVNTTK